ncbi:MAG: phage tail family protein, partial [Dehalococcoidia bacterium]|nr:phage tail family protein [Dehalococcoidia bacterium]
SVTVDMRARTARTDDGTNVMGLRSADSEMWSLEPGVNEVSVTAASGAGTTVLSYWRLLSGV